MKKLLPSLILILSVVMPTLAQKAIPQWKVDSLLADLGHPRLNYEYNFNFTFEELRGEPPSPPNPLAKLSEEELEAKLTGEPEDGKVYAQLVYRAYANREEEKVLDALKKGILAYERYINENPADSQAVADLAMMMTVTQNYDYAKQTLDYGVQKFPDHVRLHLSRFQLMYYNMGKMEEASNYIDSLVNAFPNSGELVYMKFMVEYAEHMMANEGVLVSTSDVLAPTTKYLERKPSALESRFLHKFCKVYLYMHIKGIKANEKGIDDLGILLSDPKDLLSEEQISDLESLATFFKKEEKNGAISPLLSSRVLAMCHILLGNPKEAEKMIRKQQGLAEKEEDKKAVEEALALIKLMQLEEGSEEAVDAVLEKYQNAPASKDLAIIAMFYDQRDQATKAKEYAKRVTEEYPAFSDGWQMKAYLELAEGNFDAAEKSILTAQETGTEPVYPFLLAVVYQAATEGAEVADQTLQQLIDAQPENKSGKKFRKWLTAEN